MSLLDRAGRYALPRGAAPGRRWAAVLLAAPIALGALGVQTLTARAVTISSFSQGAPTTGCGTGGASACLPGPYGVVVVSGTVWYTEAGPVTAATPPANNMDWSAVVKQVNGTTTPYSTPTAHASPRGMTFDPQNGLIYFAEEAAGANGLASINPATGVIAEYPDTTNANSGPLDVAYSPDNHDIYMTETGRSGVTGDIVQFDPSNNSMTTLSTGITPNAAPFFITAGPAGSNTMWFTERDITNTPPSISAIARINTTNGTITEFPTGIGRAQPFGITLGPDGNIWFTEQTGHAIGRYALGSCTTSCMTEGKIAPNTAPAGITTGSDGRLWFAEEAADAVGAVSPTGFNPQPVSTNGPTCQQTTCAVATYLLPKTSSTEISSPVSVAGDSTRRSVWVTENQDARVASVTVDASGYVHDYYGGLHPWTSSTPGGAVYQLPQVGYQSTSNGYFPGQAFSDAAALTPDGKSGYTIDQVGGIHPFGPSAADTPANPVLTQSYHFPFAAPVRGLALCPLGLGGYTLDSYGGIHNFGTVDGTIVTAAVGPATITGYWPFQDMTRGIVVQSCGITGSGSSAQATVTGYVLDRQGGVHAFWSANTAYPGTPTVTGFNNFDIYRGITIGPDGNFGYTLDGYGGIHPWYLPGHADEAPPASAGYGYFPGRDIMRGIVLTADGHAGYDADAYGGVHPINFAGWAPAEAAIVRDVFGSPIVRTLTELG